MSLRDKLTNLSRGTEEVDNKLVIKEWQNNLQSLYVDIQEMLSEYVSQNIARFEHRKIQIKEERLGLYDAEDLIFVSGPESLIFSPVSRYVTGAHGRVNLYRQGKIIEGCMLLHISPTVKDGWIIAVREPANRLTQKIGVGRLDKGQIITTESLTKENLERSIEALLD